MIVKKLFILISLLFSAAVLAQEEDAVLHFLDGTDLEGYGMINSSLDGATTVKFRISSDDKADYWGADMISGVSITKQGSTTHYKYVEISKGRYHPKLLLVVSEGPVMLYAEEHEASADTSMMSGNKENLSSNFDLISVSGALLPLANKTYYVKRQHESFPTKFDAILGWKKKAKKYFADCDTVVSRIEDSKYRYNTLNELVDFYNDYCVD